MKKISKILIKSTNHYSFFKVILLGFSISVSHASISAANNIIKIVGSYGEVVSGKVDDESGNKGMLKGFVLISGESSGLPFVRVSVAGTSNNTITDRDGYFIIRNIDAGNQKIRFKYFGCKTETVEITIAPDEIVGIKVALHYDPLREKETEVSIQAKGQLAAINEELSSDNIISAVPEDKLDQFPETNLAESLGRLPGVSLNRTNGEADKIIIRGLSPQYNKVTIEGIPVISTSGLQAGGNTNSGSSSVSDRSIDLSLLNDGIFERAEIIKSLSADMDADALGGTLNLRMKRAAPGFQFNTGSIGIYKNLKD
jgi:TonB-dependent Receptor Plug Domain/CarboxypepD_reg-like domain